jgi:nuclear pore complex protein Nup133
VLTAQQLFKQLVRSLFQGKALSIEDMADALSLKDNDTTISDYATALHLLAQADVSTPRIV